MPTVNEVVKLKREVEGMKEEISQLRGRIAQLKKDQGVEGLTHLQLKKKLIGLETERIDLETEFKKRLQKFKEAHHERYGDWPLTSEA